MVEKKRDQSFQKFFGDDKYLYLKNYLYNYRLRKHAVQKCLMGEDLEIILEVGSGISPMITSAKRIVYSDISLEAVQVLKKNLPHGMFVVADCMHLPFKPGVYTHVIASEVLEHLENDKGALNELGRVLKYKGRLIITFPHKKSYFAVDDRLVGHFRRYEIDEMKDMLDDISFKVLLLKKVIGPLEKCIMIPVSMVYSYQKRFKIAERNTIRKNSSLLFSGLLIRCFRYLNILLMAFAWIDARVMPFSHSAVVLIKAQKLLRSYQ